MHLPWGGVKLSDKYTSSGGTASSGVAASSYAVYKAYSTLSNSVTAIRNSIQYTNCSYIKTLNVTLPSSTSTYDKFDWRTGTSTSTTGYVVNVAQSSWITPSSVFGTPTKDTGYLCDLVITAGEGSDLAKVVFVTKICFAYNVTSAAWSWMHGNDFTANHTPYFVSGFPFAPYSGGSWSSYDIYLTLGIYQGSAYMQFSTGPYSRFAGATLNLTFKLFNVIEVI